MKAQLTTVKLVTGLTAVLALAVATGASAKNPKEVELNIVNDQLVIKSKPNANDCPWTQRRGYGCIGVKKNEKTEIYFHLRGETKCGLESGTSWELNAVYLGGFNLGSKPGEFGFDDTPDADFQKVQSDFGITEANRSTGLVTTIEKSARRLAINDDNQYKYDVWYKIEAICERDDGNPAHTTSSDPRVKNGGTD